MSKSLTRILSKEDIELLLNLIAKLLQYCDKPKYKSRGRPAKYPDEIIILSALLKVHLNLPFLRIKEFFAIMADGTGFGYDETIKLSYLKGKELRDVKSHIKTEILKRIMLFMLYFQYLLFFQTRSICEV